ncbi:MAG: class I SAM-dependent methyltransferase [Fimbriimonadaceae bacterium]|nr:class I SAM-dependent methyltransferase [Fimbriimonadaceae bacterium]
MMEAVFARSLALAQGLAPTAANIDRVASQTSSEASAWAFTQWELRERADQRFTRASEMLWDRDGLAMATSEARARYHASLVPEGEPVLDLACGLGLDLIAYARRGPATGYELDAHRAALARQNLAVHRQEADVVIGDGRDADWSDRFIYLDPMRRDHRGRLRPEDYQPNPWELVDRLHQSKGWLMKLSPLVPDTLLGQLGGGIEFLSDDGECSEALVTSLRLGTQAVHTASGEALTGNQNAAPSDRLEEYLYELDPAAVRAHASGHWGLRSIGDHPGFLTGGESVSSVWLEPFRVIKEFNPKDNPGPVSAVKKRGETPSPESLRKKWGHDNDGPIAILWTQNHAVRGCLAERIAPR